MKEKEVLTDEQFMDEAIKEGRTIPDWMHKAGRQINDIVHLEVGETGLDYYPGFSRMAFVIFKHAPEVEESAATIRSLTEVLESVESLVEFYSKREMEAPANNQEAVRDAWENLQSFRAALDLVRRWME